MNEKYWDNVASDYDGQIFSVLAYDQSQIIASKISQFADKEAVACDIGCGIGKFLPILAENFRYVHAVDLSNALLKQARQNCCEFDNINYSQKDPGVKNIILKQLLGYFYLKINDLK